MVAANEIVLAVGCSAEFGTCGSCHFFRRSMDSGPYEMKTGDCTFRLPPLPRRYKEMSYEETGESGRSPQWVQDTFGCDLYKPDGKVYIVQRRVPPDKYGP